jgi:hypothetical protein
MSYLAVAWFEGETEVFCTVYVSEDTFDTTHVVLKSFCSVSLC